MKNWKLLAVFGLIAVLFVFAGCFAGVTPEEPTATPTQAPTVAPTNTPTPTPTPAVSLTVDEVSFLGEDDSYLNKAESEADATVSGTFTGTSVRKIKVYAIKLKEIEGCAACAEACAQPETGSAIFLGEEIYSEAQSGVNVPWTVTVPKANLALLEDGAHYKIYAVAEYGVCGSCALLVTPKAYYEDCFEVDVTPPELICGCCEKGLVDVTAESSTITFWGEECCCGTENNPDGNILSEVSSVGVLENGTLTPLKEDKAWRVTVTVADTDAAGNPTNYNVTFEEIDPAGVSKAIKSIGQTDSVENVAPGVSSTFTYTDDNGTPTDPTDDKTISIKFKLKAHPCVQCSDIVLYDYTAGSTKAAINLNFSEPVSLSSACATQDDTTGNYSDLLVRVGTTLSDAIGADPELGWGLNSDDKAALITGALAETWTIYAPDEYDGDAAEGAVYKVTVKNFEDKAGNKVDEASCTGTFVDGTVDDVSACAGD